MREELRSIDVKWVYKTKMNPDGPQSQNTKKDWWLEDSWKNMEYITMKYFPM